MFKSLWIAGSLGLLITITGVPQATGPDAEALYRQELWRAVANLQGQTIAQLAVLQPGMESPAGPRGSTFEAFCLPVSLPELAQPTSMPTTECSPTVQCTPTNSCPNTISCETCYVTVACQPPTDCEPSCQPTLQCTPTEQCPNTINCSTCVETIACTPLKCHPAQSTPAAQRAAAETEERFVNQPLATGLRALLRAGLSA